MIQLEYTSLLVLLIPSIGWLYSTLAYKRGIKLSLESLLFAILTLILSAFLVMEYFIIYHVERPVIIILSRYAGVDILAFILDDVSVIITFLVVFIGFLILLFSQGYMSPANREHPISEGFSWFYSMMLLFMASMIGVILSYSLITLAIFYELTGLCSFMLIGFFHKEQEARYAAKKALYITHLGWLFLIIAIAVQYWSIGSVDLGSIDLLNPSIKTIFMILIMLSAWSKSAQFPFYLWLPDAMIAPTPVSAYLHAAAMVKVGVYMMFRVIQYSPPLEPIISYTLGVMAVVTMLYGLTMYIPQSDMKRLLAYSTITQLSYIFLALSFASLGVASGLRGAFYHIWNHAYAKALFFLTAGSLSYATGSRYLTDYRGIIGKSRIIALSFAIAAFSIIGVPPLNCFYSKFTIFTAGFETKSMWGFILTIIAIGESVLCFIIFLNWLIKCIYGSPSTHVEEMQSIPKSISASLVVLVIMCFISAYLIYPIVASISFAGGV